MVRKDYETYKMSVISAQYPQNIEMSKLEALKILANEESSGESMADAEHQQELEWERDVKPYRNVLLCKHGDFKHHPYRHSLLVVYNPDLDYVTVYTFGSVNNDEYQKLKANNQTYELVNWQDYGFDHETGVYLHRTHDVLKSDIASWKFCKLDDVDVKGIANKLGITVEASINCIFDYEDAIVDFVYSSNKLVWL